MARAAVPGGLTRAARVAARRARGAPAPRPRSATTLVLDVPDWPGHLAGQHVDVRLTAEDGYQATRSYSLAGPADGDRVEITVQRVADGEVSPFLVDDLAVGDAVEVRGPGRRLVRLAARPARAGAPGRRRLGRRAADGDDPGARRAQPGAVPARLLRAHARGPDLREELRRRVARGRWARRRLGATPGRARRRSAARRAASAPTTWPPTAGRPTSSPPATSAARPASSRPRRHARRSGPRPGPDPDRAVRRSLNGRNEPMDARTEGATYDGNVLAGPLAEVFAVEVTTAVARCRGCGRVVRRRGAGGVRAGARAGRPVPRVRRRAAADRADRRRGLARPGRHVVAAAAARAIAAAGTRIRIPVIPRAIAFCLNCQFRSRQASPDMNSPGSLTRFG